jgi:hypothetical protein
MTEYCDVKAVVVPSAAVGMVLLTGAAHQYVIDAPGRPVKVDNESLSPGSGCCLSQSRDPDDP